MDHNNDIELINEGISNMRKGNYSIAEQFFNKAIEMKGANLPMAQYNKGVLYHKHLNDMQLALECYKEATSLQPNYGYAWHNLGEVLCHFNYYAKGKEMFQKAIDQIPDELPPRLGLAYAQNRLGEFANSINILEQLLERDNQDKELLAKINSELGLALLQTQQAQRAYKHFKKAFDLNEKDYQVCYNIAFIADAFQSYEEAIEFYDKAIALNGKEAKGHQGKACTLIHTKRYGDALEYIQKAIELNPENFEGYYNLACIHAGLGEEDELLSAINKTIALAPRQIGIERHILNDPDFLPFTKQQNFIAVLTRN
ncbi:tetratricopeptide repeat protein [Flagellimonas meishanensis]|uniref:tetratricopeptide repeat protein n=1 Tax=Flagellimonas meishanensis TaxID=2873264 RepID=UPI001CA5F56D|nr:tetratricopeptide repeat protein [[Muricauda] meishanensis]